MKHVKKSVLLWYAPAEMYALVTDVEHYPEFLPWCNQAEVLERRADGITARVGMSISGIRQAFTTRNTHVPDEQVHMELVDGPFSRLDGVWRFLPLPKPQTCKVEFELNYAFSSRALELVVSPVFDHIANTFVDRFVKRAEAVYGAR
jgi:ribosome-associated toxin RatA of RatAB toxin-antitoxin module